MAAAFPTTRWSVVLGATDKGSTPKTALRELCVTYWRPLYAYVRRRGASPEDAEDTVQGFLASLLDGPAIERVDRERGRFRSYVLGALRHYMAKQRTRANAAKRGGGQVPLALDIDRDEVEGQLQISDERTPEGAYAYAWAMEILGTTQDRLRQRYAADGREALYAALEPFVRSAEVPAYREVAAQLGMTEAATRVAVHRMRTRFRLLLREVVADTVDTEAEIDDEIRSVIDALQGQGRA